MSQSQSNMITSPGETMMMERRQRQHQEQPQQPDVGEPPSSPSSSLNPSHHYNSSSNDTTLDTTLEEDQGTKRRRRLLLLDTVEDELNQSVNFLTNRYVSTTDAAVSTTSATTTTTTTSMSTTTKSHNSGGTNDSQPQQQQQQQPHTTNQTRTHTTGETKLSKIAMRVVFGSCMFTIFITLVYLGHLYICGLIVMIELLLFRELVRVRYSSYYQQIHNTIPLFRTTQWLWFAVAISYTYGDFIVEILQNNTSLHYLIYYTHYLPTILFVLYSGTFVLTIITLQRDSIKFQINQLCWTILVLCLTVGQLKYIMHNIFNGLIWFVLPCCLVFTNDIMAYVSGVSCGRKFIHRPFISFSPNKTWEGFIGGWFFTMIVSWHLSRFLAHYTWMTCPMYEFRLHISESLTCELDPIFLPAQSYIPSQIFELLPISFVKILFPNIVEICAVRSSSGSSSNSNSATMNTFEELTRCVSGESSHQHHHFELSIQNYYPIQMHALWLGMFASLVAPFGGFLASAIKRAYGIKDFDSLIPGHGGVMDRMDCQFLMALYTWVHYNSFVKFSTISVPKLTYMYSLLSEQQQREFLRIVMSTSNWTTIANATSMSTSSSNAVNVEMDGSTAMEQ